MAETKTYREALREAMVHELDNDESVVLMGEDIGVYGGTHLITDGLYDEYGPRRIMDVPISENGFVGAAVGMAMMGRRPVVEMMTWNFSFMAADQSIQNAAKVRYFSGGQVEVPLVIRGPNGGRVELSAEVMGGERVQADVRGHPERAGARQGGGCDREALRLPPAGLLTVRPGDGPEARAFLAARHVTEALVVPLRTDLNVAVVMEFVASAVTAAVLHWPDVVAQVLFTPLLSVMSIWVAIAISTRAGDVRVAQQLGALDLQERAGARLASRPLSHVDLGPGPRLEGLAAKVRDLRARREELVAALEHASASAPDPGEIAAMRRHIANALTTGAVPAFTCTMPGWNRKRCPMG